MSYSCEIYKNKNRVIVWTPLNTSKDSKHVMNKKGERIPNYKTTFLELTGLIQFEEKVLNLFFSKGFLMILSIYSIRY